MRATETESTTTARDSAQAFVDRLLDEGSKVSCDDTNENFKSSFDLPIFYDEELFKKGQQFFHKHIYGMFFSKMHGLIVVLSIPTILKILIMTKMSGSDMTAYRRYLATVYHMMIWYDKDFKPGSDLWNSIAEVRRLHNSASKRGNRCNLNNISQMDMALTQFGFMGFALCRSRKVGIHNATEEEWASLIHLWRVVGHLLGIEDRFNLCRGSVEETREICNLLCPQVFKPLMDKRDKDVFEMTGYLINGLWSILPIITHSSLLTYCYSMISMSDDTGESEAAYLKLEGYSKFFFSSMIWMMKMLQYDWFRIFNNYSLYGMLWLSKWLPIIAIARFGISRSYVKLRLSEMQPQSVTVTTVC